jgi:hypothetical protein
MGNPRHVSAQHFFTGERLHAGRRISTVDRSGARPNARRLPFPAAILLLVRSSYRHMSLVISLHRESSRIIKGQYSPKETHESHQ